MTYLENLTTPAPTAADQQTLISAAQLLPTDGSYRWLICAEDAASWHFWAGAIPTGGGDTDYALFSAASMIGS